MSVDNSPLDNDSTDCNPNKRIFMFTTRTQREMLQYVLDWSFAPIVDENDNIISDDSYVQDNEVFDKLTETLIRSLAGDKQSQVLSFRRCEFEDLLSALQPIFSTIELRNVDDLYIVLDMI